MGNWVVANAYPVLKENMLVAVNVQTAHHHANPATTKLIAYHVLKNTTWNKITAQMYVHWTKFPTEQYAQHVLIFVQFVIYKTHCVLSVPQATIFTKADV